MAIDISALNAFRGAADIPMGAITHEITFEFDLSDENEAKLTSANFKQTI